MQLKSLRKQRGLSQSEAAEALGISLRAYQNYEYEQREPNIEMINRLADFYHVTTDYLLGRESKEETVVDALAYEFDMSLLEKKIVNGYLTLPKEQRKNVMDFIVKMVEETHDEAVAHNAELEKGKSPPEVDIEAAAKAAWEQSGRITEMLKTRNKV